MRAHIIENGIVANTIEVESLDFMPDLLDASLGGQIGDLYENGAFIKPPSPPPEIPQVVTIRQAKLALLSAGLLDDIDAAIALADRNTQIEWEYATEVRRDWPTLLSVQQALGLTDEQVDDLFRLAVTL